MPRRIRFGHELRDDLLLFRPQAAVALNEADVAGQAVAG